MTSDFPVRDRCSLTLPNDLGYLPVGLGFVRNFGEILGFDETDLKRIELALDEAATNVIKHAFPAGEVASFDIVCQKIPGGMEVCVHDKGIPWDPTLDEDYHPEADLQRQTGLGLGEYLIKHLMDGYVFSNLGHDGKQLHLVKYLKTARIGEGEEIAPTPEVAKPSKTNPEPVAVEIRRMRPQEAIEVSRAIFDSYGYSYASDFVYYPERIAAMNEGGQMLSAVAVVKDTGEIAGHNALVFSGSLPAELAIAVTKRQFRGQGIAEKTVEFLASQARAMGLKGVYTKEVTVHPFTQKFVYKLGFRDCGLLLAHSPKTLSFKGIAEQAAQRNSDVLGFKPIGDPEPRELYLPTRHAEIIASIYSGLAIPMGWKSSTAVPDNARKTVLHATVSPSRLLCEIHISRYGADLVTVLKQELRRVRRQELQLVEMYLNLADPLTPWAVKEAERLGFFFTGILPETRGGDSFVLQYFNGIGVEYDQLVIDRPGTVKLVEYVKGLDPTMA